MMKLTIEVNEQSKSNLSLLDTFGEITKQIQQGFTSGGDKSDTGDFWFNIKEG